MGVPEIKVGDGLFRMLYRLSYTGPWPDDGTRTRNPSIK